MIESAYAMLAQEPWCYTPWEIGQLTDWQIERLYRKPAEDRAEQFKKDFPDTASAPGTNGKPLGKRRSESVEESDLGEPGSPSHRNWHLSAYMNGPLRYSPERARAMYEKQLAQWKAEQGK